MSRLPCKWLYKTRFGCYCNCSVFFQRRNFADESHCLGCEVYEPSSVCPTCKHYDNTTDTEEEFCHALGEVIGDIAMGNSKITTCEYWCENNLKDDDTMVKVRSFCKYLDVDKDTQKFICHFTSLNGGASMILSGDTCLKCNYYKPIVCKYQNEQNDCTKSVQQFPCVFAQCNAWEAAEAQCRYFEHIHEHKLCGILRKIDTSDLTFLEKMLKDDASWTMKQISFSLSGRYDP